jgi:hypothetical protein
MAVDGGTPVSRVRVAGRRFLEGDRFTTLRRPRGAANTQEYVGRAERRHVSAVAGAGERVTSGLRTRLVSRSRVHFG